MHWLIYNSSPLYAQAKCARLNVFVVFEGHFLNQFVVFWLILSKWVCRFLGGIEASAAFWAKKNLKCKAKVALITQDNLVTVKARGNGAERALKQICPEIEIVARYHADNPYRGMNVMDWILPSHPDLNMVVTTTDASAIGSYLALQVNEISGKDIAVFSGDATQDALHMIAEDNSVFRGTVNLYPFQGGYDSVMRLYEMVQNGAPAFPKFETLPYTALSQEQVRSGDYERSF